MYRVLCSSSYINFRKNMMSDWCCSSKCFKIPQIHVDGLACGKCRSYNYCICACVIFQTSMIEKTNSEWCWSFKNTEKLKILCKCETNRDNIMTYDSLSTVDENKCCWLKTFGPSLKTWHPYQLIRVYPGKLRNRSGYFIMYRDGGLPGQFYVTDTYFERNIHPSGRSFSLETFNNEIKFFVYLGKGVFEIQRS